MAFMWGAAVCEDVRTLVTRSHSLASTVRTASVESPAALDRNRQFILDQLETAREHLAAVEAKLGGKE